MHATRSLCALLSLLVCGTAACGGSSSAPGSVLSGTYHFVGVSGETDGGPQFAATWGTLTADGGGTLSLTTRRNENDVADGMAEMETGISYAVAGDRTVTVWDPSQPSVLLARGRISAAGDVAVLAAAAAGQEPGFFLAVRKGGSFATSTLDGPYHACMLRYDSIPEVLVGSTGTFTFDGLGGFTGGVSTNAGGALGSDALSGTYSVDPDGTAEVDLPFGSLRGGLLADGRLGVFAGSAQNGAPPALLVVVRATPLAESWAIDFADHRIAGLERETTGLHFRSYDGVLDIEDNLGFTGTWDRNDEGTIAPQAPWSEGWVSDPDGAFGFYDAGGALYSCGLEQTGRYAVAGGGRLAGANPALFFLVR